MRYRRSVVTACLLLLSVAVCHAHTVSSDELIERARDLDTRVVTYKGELVTAILPRGEHSWANLNDGSNAIGVWCESGSLRGVKFIGDYKKRGDILEVEGIFNRACREHGGELDIHADKVRVAQEGFYKIEEIGRARPILAIVFFCLTALVALRYRNRN